MSIYRCNFDSHESSDDGETRAAADDDGDKNNKIDERPHLLLGRITAGSFSPSRGVCHGIGIVSASFMLKYLIQCCLVSSSESNKSDQNQNSGLVVRLPNGAKSLQLSVMAGTKGSRHLRPACISLIATV